jgi:hypothetical protein
MNREQFGSATDPVRNKAMALRDRPECQRDQLTELTNTDFELWAKESNEIAVKIVYRNDGPDWNSEGRCHELCDGRSGSGTSGGVRSQCEPDC